MDNRKLLLSLSLKYNGDYDRIASDVFSKRFPDEDVIESAESNINSKYITVLDDVYPDCLKNSYHPPFVLYYYGDISLLKEVDKAIALIGSRDPCEYGKQITKDLVSDLSSDFVIVSGLSRGIGTIALNECFNNNGKSIVVLGSGIDKCYPFDNFNLYEEVKEKGLLISEYPNDLSPEATFFPMRNRIIAALSRGIIVTDAKNRSGTMITALFGLSASKNKDVMCVPYRIDDGSGCNDLIKSGAYLVENSDDVRLILSSHKGGF